MAEHGQPLIFGKERDKGLRLKPGRLELEVVTIGEDGISEADIMVHDETDRMLATLLASLETPTAPVVVGVIYCDPAPSYERQVHEHSGGPPKMQPADINALLRQGHTWTVDG